MTLLPEIEHALLDAVARDQAARRPARLARIRGRSLRLPAVALLALLGTTTIALAASGVILTGSNVPTPRRLRPGYELGVPARGGSELLPLRAPDPAGGLPWGMRIVRTTRGYLCVQIGRVQDGMLGELGIDGAFHDDGRFHPLPVRRARRAARRLASTASCPADRGSRLRSPACREAPSASIQAPRVTRARTSRARP